MKKAFFFVFLALAFVLAGCQPIAPTDTAQIDQLREQNQSLSQQLLESQRQILDLQSQVEALSTQVAQLPPAPIQEGALHGLATEILSLLQSKDFAALAPYVHPQAGLRFSPLLFIHTDTDLVFTREQVANFASDNNIYTWGTLAARGDLLQMSVVDYWIEYVIPLMSDQQW